MRRAPRSILLALLVLFLGTDATAESPNAFADLDDAGIRDRVARLLGGTGDLAGPMDADEVVLARVVTLECRRFDATRTENRFVLVRRVAEGARTTVEIPLDPVDLRGVQGWILREDGTVERQGAFGEAAGARPIDPGRRVVLTFDAPRPGDVWGWTAISDFDFGLDHRQEDLSVDRPVLRTRVHVESGAQVSYWAEALRDDDLDLRTTIVDRRDGRPRHVQIDVTGVPARRDALFSAPPAMREPALRITRRGRYYPALRTWMLRNDWDLWAALEVGSPTRWLDDGEEVHRLALEVASRGSSTQDRVDRLFLWVRDNVRLVRDTIPDPLFEDADRVLDLDPTHLIDDLESRRGPDSMVGWRQPFEWEENEITGDPMLGRGLRDEPVRPVLDVIASGEATALERAVLFASLVRAAQIEVVIGFVRDARLGPLDFEATGRWQFTDMVVAPVDPDFVVRRWYCPTRPGIDPGALDVGLYDNSTVFIDPLIDERLDALWSRLWRDEGATADRLIPAYVENVRAQRLTRILRTPPAPPPMPEVETEVIRFTTEGARGRTDGGQGAAHWAERFPGTVVALDPEAALPAALGLELPPPNDGVWVLPGARVFGRGPFAGWKGLPRPPFHLDRPRTYVWTVELPVPEGWDGVTAVDAPAIESDAFTYRVRTVPGDRTFVIERELALSDGTWDDANLVAIDRAVRDVLAFERDDMVLRSTGRSR